MKKYIYGWLMALVALTTFSACSEDEGTEPGNDKTANVIVYQYNAESPYDSDVDTRLRIATNTATESAYILSELTTDYENRLASLGENGYKEYVVSNGSKIGSVSGTSVVDTTLVNLTGTYTITVVAVGNGAMSSSTVNFVGQTWTTVASGTYYFSKNAANSFGESSEAILQYKDSDPNTYRFKDFWSTGNHLTFTLTGDTTTTSSGSTVKVLKVSAQATPYSYGSYGTIYYADMNTYNSSWSYTAYLTPSNNVVIPMIYYVSAGYLAYGYDQFVANE